MPNKSTGRPHKGASAIDLGGVHRFGRRRQILLGGAGLLAASALTAATLPAAAAPASVTQTQTVKAGGMTSAIVGGTRYRIRQLSSSPFRYLDAWEDGGHGYRAVIRPFQNNDTQRWRAINLGNNRYRFVQVSTGRYLDAWEDGGHDYRAVTVAFQNSDSQRWRAILFPGTTNRYRFVQVSTGRYLDAWTDAAHDYNAVTRPFQANNTQWWIVTPLP